MSIFNREGWGGGDLPISSALLLESLLAGRNITLTDNGVKVEIRTDTLNNEDFFFGTSNLFSQKFVTTGLPWSSSSGSLLINSTGGETGNGTLFVIGNEVGVAAGHLVLSNTATDMANKEASYAVPQYDISNTPVACLSVLNNITENIVSVGGGTGLAGNATEVRMNISPAVGNNTGVDKFSLLTATAEFKNLTNGLRISNTGSDFLQINFNDTEDRVEIGTNNQTTMAMWIKSSTTAAGANIFSDVDTDTTDKFARISTYPFNMSQDPVSMITIVNDVDDNLLAIGGFSGSHQAVTDIDFYTAATVNVSGGSQRMQIKESGLIEINSIGSNLEVETNGNAELIGVSDESLKENIVSCPYGLAEIKLVNPIKFSWITDRANISNTLYADDMENEGTDQTREDIIDGLHTVNTIGFSANNVNTVIPEAAPLQEYGPMAGKFGFNSKGVLAALVNSVKELATRIEALEAS